MSFRENRGELWRFCATALCMLIFLFALQAKLEHYTQHSHSKIYLSTFSKLRIEVDETKTFVPPIIVQFFAAAITYGLLLGGEPLVQKMFGSLVAHNQRLAYQTRFLRPPPSHS